MSNLSTADQSAINWASEEILAGRTIDLTVWHRHPTGTDYSTGGPIGPGSVVNGRRLADRSETELRGCLADGAGWRGRGAFLDRLVWRYRVSLRDQAKASGPCQVSRA